MNKSEQDVEGPTITNTGAPGTWAIVFKSGAVVTIEDAQLCRVNNGSFGYSEWQFIRGSLNEVISLTAHLPGSVEKGLLDTVIDGLIKIK